MRDHALNAGEMVLIASLAIGLALRFFTLGAVGVIETDGVRYVQIAHAYRATGSAFDALFHPLYPLCVALMEPVVGDAELAGRLVSVLAGAAMIVPAWALARALLGGPVAAVTALLLAVHPGLVRSSAAVLSESTYALLVVLGAYVGWRGLRQGPRLLLPLAGALFGLAYLTRPEGVLYAVGLLAAVGLAARRAPDRSWLVAAGAGALVAFVLLAAPYVLYLRHVLGFWTLSGKVAHGLALDVGLAAPGGRSDVLLLLTHPVLLARHVVENGFLFEKYTLAELLPGVTVLFLLPGLAPRAAEGGWRGREGLLLLLAAPPLVALAFHVEVRVFLPSLPFLLALVAAGLAAAAGWLRSPAPRVPWLPLLALTVVLALLPYALRPIVRPDAGSSVYRDAAEWVAASQPRSAVVMDRKPFVAFYSGRPFVPLPTREPGALAQAARSAGARLVVLDSRALEDRPALLPALWGAPPAGLVLARDFDPAPGQRLRVLLVGAP